MSLTVIAYANAKPGKEAELKKILSGFVAPTLAEDGCINYDLHEELEHPGRFFFYENWTSHEALAAHAKSQHIVSGAAAAASLMTESIKVVLLKKI